MSNFDSLLSEDFKSSIIIGTFSLFCTVIVVFILGSAVQRLTDEVATTKMCFDRFETVAQIEQCVRTGGEG